MTSQNPSLAVRRMSSQTNQINTDAQAASVVNVSLFQKGGVTNMFKNMFGAKGVLKIYVRNGSDFVA